MRGLLGIILLSSALASLAQAECRRIHSPYGQFTTSEICMRATNCPEACVPGTKTNKYYCPILCDGAETDQRASLELAPAHICAQN